MTRDEASAIATCRAFVEEATPIFAYEIVWEGRWDPYARLRVTPSDGRTDTALCFMVLRDDAWEVLGLGTCFEPAALADWGVPVALWPG